MLDTLISFATDNWQTLAISSAAIFLAAIVRGFSGFGFSLLSITAISLLLPAREIVPSIFLLEVAASINLIPSIWREIDWRSIGWLLLGYVIALPFGIFALARFPEVPMQLAMSIFVLWTAIMMLRGFRLAKTPSAAATTATGAASGIFNGAFGIGGPPVVLFYFSTPAAAAVSRASVIAFFLSTDVLGLTGHYFEGLLTTQSFAQFFAWLPALLIGVWVGAHGFRRIDQALFRRMVLVILAALAVLSLGKALYDWQ
ncbi:sulfite exporter TauE/SafE family protein [Dongia sp.]|uniref:sulfite exporter TauE/SafE family protein n=1 Tax=Dongia sp. TaxID=1977262 RepID=UPI0035ADFB06